MPKKTIKSYSKKRRSVKHRNRIMYGGSLTEFLCVYDKRKLYSGHIVDDNFAKSCSLESVSKSLEGYPNSCSWFKKLESKVRLGSDSSNAQVFLINIDPNDTNCPAAAKILVPTPSMSMDDLESEIAITRLAQNISFQHFVPIYNSFKCDNIFIKPGTTLYKNAIKYVLLEYAKKNGLGDDFISETGKYYPLLDNGKFRDYISKMDKKLSTKFPHQVNEIPIKGFVMVQELMWGDLRQLFECTRTKEKRQFTQSEKVEFFNDIFTKIFQAVDKMHDSGIIHNDLHDGNIMFRVHRDETIDAVIGDFGASKTYNKQQANDKFFGMVDFDAIINTSFGKSDKTVPIEIKTKLKKFNNLLQRHGTKNSVNLWNKI